MTDDGEDDPTKGIREFLGTVIGKVIGLILTAACIAMCTAMLRWTEPVVGLAAEVVSKVFGDADTRFVSCRSDALENGGGEVPEESVDSEGPVTCLDLPGWMDRLTEDWSAYEKCPDPVDQRLVRLRALEGDLYDESVLYADARMLCCDSPKICNPDAVQDRWNRMEELWDSISREVDAYNAAHAEK